MNREKTIHVGFLVVDKHEGRGGLEKVLVDVVQGLQERGVNTTVLMLQRPDNQNYLNSFENIFSMDIHPNYYNAFLPKFLQRQIWKRSFKKEAKNFLFDNLRTLKLDALIVLNISKNFLRILPVIEEIKKDYPQLPIIAWPHISFRTLNNKKLQKNKAIMRVFDRVFAISGGMKSEMEDMYSLENIDLLYNPIKPVDEYPKRNIKRLIYLGRINDSRKRVNSLVRLFTQLKGDWTLDIIGGSGNEEMDIKFQQYINSLGLHEKIIFHGWVDDPWSKVKEAGVLLLNSTFEGFPLVLLEAMVRGIPCVSSDCATGPNEIIRTDINGWLYPVNDEGKCLNIIQKIIDEKLTLPSREQVVASVTSFSEDVVIDNFKKNIIKTLIVKKAK